MDFLEEEEQMSVVPCLMPLLTLQKECEREGLKLSRETNKYFIYEMLKKLGPSQSQKLIAKLVEQKVIDWNDDFEVESILEHCYDEDEGKTFYLIKWLGWNKDYNTWEPEDNVSEEALSNYRKRKYAMHRSEVDINTNARKVEELFFKLNEAKITETMSPNELLSYCNPVKKMARAKYLIAGGALDTWPRKVRTKLVAKRKTKKVKKEEVQAALRNWQNHLNSICKGYDSAPLMVENTVDLEGPPSNFIYINERKEGVGVEIPKDPLVGCECDDCYDCRKTCCPVNSGSKPGYSKTNKRLLVPRGIPLYECNSRCKCGPDCYNRVVQKGRKVKVSIFRTKSRGWGVKSLQLIKKGTFVMEYVGEVITNEEAERRGAEYDACGLTYLFDLDFHDAEGPYSVDAGVYGNAAHFINHSCDPNLEVHVVWVSTLDPRFPHICLFAKRDIQKNEELTFDYLSGQANSSMNKSSSELEGQLLDEINGKLDEVDGQFAVPTAAPVASPDLTNLIAKPSSLPVLPTSLKSPGLDLISEGAVGPTPPASDTESLSGSSTDILKPRFKMACLCGTTRCRKYLFI